MASTSCTRRTFLAAVGAHALAAGTVAAKPPPPPRKRIAVVTTVWNDRSHAWHMAERFLAGFPLRGRWHRPPIDVASAYVDQTPANDLSAGRAREFGFTRYRSIAEALRCGGDRLAVDGVLVIGEHGDYPVNEIGQKQYPRYEFFQQIVDVFRRDGRTVPVFNDKHLSWRWEWAREMVDTARRMDFPFLAGSSLPVTWRMPAIDLPWEAAVEEVVGVAYGAVDIYDFHALEMIQSMVERRGGETGVTAVQGLRGPAVWQALEAGGWDRGGLDPRLFETCLARSHTLRQAEAVSHRYPTLEQMRSWVREPIAYRIEYADGLKATMLLLNGLVQDFTFAARVRGQAEPISTLFHLPPNPNVVYSAALMAHASAMFETGRAAYPVERTLLTSGLVASGLASLAQAGRRLTTPHLAVRYTAPRESTFCRE